MAIFTMEVALLEKESKEMNAEEIDADHTAEASSDSETEQEPMENQAESTVDQEKVDALEEQLTKIQQEKDETYDRMLRIQAEFDNFKRRTKREREADRKYKAQDLANKLLPVIDNFERAFETEVPEEANSFVEGMSMVYRQLTEALKSEGVEVIETIGKPFDPNIHHAVMQVEDEETDSEVIVEELQKGYMLKDRVIRPAMVKVNK